MIHAGLALAGTAIFAHGQSAGKGQHGKTWFSQSGDSLSLSLILDPRPLTFTQQFRLSACIAVCVCEFLNEFTNGDMRIKWPNDLYWQDRKAGGILIESVIGNGSGTAGLTPGPSGNETAASWKWAVAGIGININQPLFGQGLRNPVSLTQVTGRRFIPVDLAKALTTKIDAGLRELKAGNLDHFFDRFNELLYRRNQKTRFRKGNIIFEGVIRGVNGTGHLKVEHGTLEEYSVGQLEFLLDE